MDGTVETRAPMKLAISRKSAPNYTGGRRTFFKYRDLGVAEATGGSMRAQVMEGITGMTEPTGWHVHHCQAQFVYIIKGWVDLEFEDGTRTRLEAGDSVMIPGRCGTTSSAPRPTWRSWNSPSPARWAPRPATRRPT